MKNSYDRGAWTKMRSTSLSVGFLLALSFVFFAFTYTTHPRPVTIPEGPIWTVDEVYLTPPIPKAKVYIPPVKTVEPRIEKPIIPEEFIIDESDDSFFEEDFETMDDPILDNPFPEGQAVEVRAAPVVQPPIEDEKDEVVLFPQRMPVFGECYDIMNEQERQMCSTKAILAFIRNNLKYPEMAKEVGVSGKVVAKFVISKSGEVTDIEILRDLGAGTGTEVLRVLNMMPTWKPGKQNLRPVSVQMIVPVKFELM